MAKLSLETTEIINQLKQELLELVNEATATEFNLFEMLGETEMTLIVLEELKNVSQEVALRYSQLSNLQLRVAEAQPMATSRLLELLIQTTQKTQNRFPAWQHSIKEVKLDWNLL